MVTAGVFASTMCGWCGHMRRNSSRELSTQNDSYGGEREQCSCGKGEWYHRMVSLVPGVEVVVNRHDQDEGDDVSSQTTDHRSDHVLDTHDIGHDEYPGHDRRDDSGHDHEHFSSTFGILIH